MDNDDVDDGDQFDSSEDGDDYRDPESLQSVESEHVDSYLDDGDVYRNEGRSHLLPLISLSIVLLVFWLRKFDSGVFGRFVFWQSINYVYILKMIEMIRGNVYVDTLCSVQIDTNHV